jgi:hypothetical protein
MQEHVLHTIKFLFGQANDKKVDVAEVSTVSLTAIIPYIYECYGRYIDPDCNYHLPLCQMLFGVFHSNCYTVLDTLVLYRLPDLVKMTRQ